MLIELRSAVLSHTGEFLCSEIRNKANSKTVAFRHVASAADNSIEVPDFPGLRAFYVTFGSLTLYLDDESGDSAYYIAEPSQWGALKAAFVLWFESMGEEEMEEYVPSWVQDCIVVGEVPRSGNYLLVPSSGSECGKVFEFEHDGFEFIALGSSLGDFVQSSLDPGPSQLTEMASHMRFIAGDSKSQWWIEEMRDNRGNAVRTKG